MNRQEALTYSGKICYHLLYKNLNLPEPKEPLKEDDICSFIEIAGESIYNSDIYRIHYLYDAPDDLPETGKEILMWEIYDDGTVFHEICEYEKREDLGWAFAWKYIEDPEI